MTRDTRHMTFEKEEEKVQPFMSVSVRLGIGGTIPPIERFSV